MSTTFFQDVAEKEGYKDGFVFNANHRCDACNSQAYLRAHRQVESGATQELFFCGHHGRKSLVGLEAQGFTVLDRTDLINAKPSQSSV